MDIDVEIEKIVPGDSTMDWVIVRHDFMRKPKVISDHVCKVKVEGTAIDRLITTLQADNKAFIGGLTPAETAEFVHGRTYLATVTLAKASENFHRTSLVQLVADKDGDLL